MDKKEGEVKSTVLQKEVNIKNNKIQTVLKVLMVLEWIVVLMDLQVANYFLKPSVVGIMSVYTLTLSSKIGSTYKYYMAGGFFFSVIGDIILLKDSLDFFLCGLISFALGHISFCIGNIQHVSFQLKEFKSRTLPIIIINFLLGNFMFWYLTNLPDFQQFMVIPLGIYIVLLSMSTVIASMRRYTSNKSYLLFLIGGYLFVISDSILSLYVFAGLKYPIVNFFIMVSYYLSEYSFFVSTIHHLNYEQHPNQIKDD